MFWWMLDAVSISGPVTCSCCCRASSICCCCFSSSRAAMFLCSEWAPSSCSLSPLSWLIISSSCSSFSARDSGVPDGGTNTAGRWSEESRTELNSQTKKWKQRERLRKIDLKFSWAARVKISVLDGNRLLSVIPFSSHQYFFFFKRKTNLTIPC